MRIFASRPLFTQESPQPRTKPLPTPEIPQFSQKDIQSTSIEELNDRVSFRLNSSNDQRGELEKREKSIVSTTQQFPPSLKLKEKRSPYRWLNRQTNQEDIEGVISSGSMDGRFKIAMVNSKTLSMRLGQAPIGWKHR